MIRIKRFSTDSYTKLREGYLREIGCSEGLRERVCKNKNGFPEGLKNYLFDDDVLNTDKLDELVAGPRIMPESFGGTGVFASMRDFFEDTIRSIGTVSMTEDEKKCCEEVFDYNILDKKCRCDRESKNVAYWLMSQLDVNVCPYCNRIYTMHIRRSDAGRTIRAEFDHFYPKSIYPYFAISLFNLIPSCAYCNRLKKNDAEKYYPPDGGYTCRDNYSILYPYDESFDKLGISISLCVVPEKDDAKVMSGTSDCFSIGFQRIMRSGKSTVPSPMGLMDKSFNDDDGNACMEFVERARHSIRLFRLDTLYSEHKKEIIRLIKMRYVYNQCGIEMILKPLLDNDDITDLTAKELMHFAFLKGDEWGESPLNKLKHDILEQIDILEEVGIGR